MSLELRDATAGDLPAILAIYNHEVETGVATWDTEPRTLAQQGEWLGEHQAPFCAIVAMDDGVVAGWGSLSSYRPRSGYRFTVEDTVYVRPDYQRRGVGRALLEELVARGRSAGFHAVLAKIEGENQASIELHRSCGFFEAGREIELGFKFDRWLDIVTMQMLLG